MATEDTKNKEKETVAEDTQNNEQVVTEAEKEKTENQKGENT